MKKIVALLLASIACSAAHASAAPPQTNAIDILDPAANALIASDAFIETIHFSRHLQFHFFEGPVWHKNGNFLTFSDIPGNSIDKWQDGKFTAGYVKDIFTGKDLGGVVVDTEPSGLHYVHKGPNGLTLDRQGRLIICAMGSGAILRREPDGKLTVLADSYEGHHLNAPDDVVVKSDGSIYFTEFRGGLVNKDKTPQEGAPGPLVYRLKDGKLTVVASDIGLPNGLAFSPDEKYLYVDDSHVKKIRRYEVNPDGTLKNGKVFVDMNGDTSYGGSGAIKVDVQGNVWNTGPGGVWIITPEGKHIATIRTIRLTNLGWGGADGKTLFLTGPGYVLKVPTKVAGILP